MNYYQKPYFFLYILLIHTLFLRIQMLFLFYQYRYSNPYSHLLSMNQRPQFDPL